MNAPAAAQRTSRSSLGMGIKRLLDLAIGVAVLVVASPVLLASAVAVRMSSPGPVLFRQQRVGRYGRMFAALKFRTMQVNTFKVSELGQVDEAHPLVTGVGRILRRTKIDELPQLFNILRGQMSLVGPRPTVAEQVEQYDDFQRLRLQAMPGLTGWAQVNGNTQVTWDERILLDVWYIDHWSVWLDLKILLRTFRVVCFGEKPSPRILQEARDHAYRTYRRG
jgi:lipopolysaccharide/colanic/teichoic acid biosynthesis glycosyltransferase